ncbi:unnamed protein product [marine sediment metagenome]|uniref:Uncharacterized protein n=1 Tax=marine sediment metagenome TaxID=412755 RepID=X0SUU0_9ZZZZ
MAILYQPLRLVPNHKKQIQLTAQTQAKSDGCRIYAFLTFKFTVQFPPAIKAMTVFKLRR